LQVGWNNLLPFKKHNQALHFLEYEMHPSPEADASTNRTTGSEMNKQTPTWHLLLISGHVHLLPNLSRLKGLSDKGIVFQLFFLAQASHRTLNGFMVLSTW